jgi:hypothetical protein
MTLVLTTIMLAPLPFFTCLLLLLTPPLVSSAVLGKQRHDMPNQRFIMVKNLSGRRVDVFWINTLEPRGPDGKYELRSNSENGQGYPYGGDTALQSYIGHEFEIQEMPAKSSGKCLHEDQCRTGYFKVNDEEDQGENNKKKWLSF